MNINFLVLGRMADRRMEELTQEYIKRVRHYVPFEMTVLPNLRNTASLTEAQQKVEEEKQLQKCLQAGDYIVLLDEHGKMPRSVEFARWMEKRMAAGPRRLVFIVGGPYGFSDGIYNMAHEKLSLSPMTFSHQMIRLIFCEQMYRAMTILNGEPYHHE